MTKILYWNIKQFSINKINQPQMTGKRKPNGSLVTPTVPTQDSASRREFILDTLKMQTPDIFVIVETATGQRKQGTLISSTGGQQGSLDLLLGIRTATKNNSWMLVPPLTLGGGSLCEGISVYFDSSKLVFTGPFGWQGNAAKGPGYTAVKITPSIKLVAYSGDWANTLPTTKTPKVTGIINPDIPQNQLAGQWVYMRTDDPTKKLQFPASSDRPPFLTTFWDIANNRNIKLLSYHAPPSWPSAAKGTAVLAKITEMTTALGDQDVGVMVGDFNVNLFDTSFEPVAYVPLVQPPPTGAGYTRQVNPTPNATFPEMAYVCTTLKLVFDTRKNRNLGAAPWDTNGYPGYSYIVANSYDNVLTRYGKSAGGPAQNITIVNRITGSPYDKVPVPTGVEKGSLAYTSSLAGGTATGGALPLPPPAPGGYPVNTAGVKTNFRDWDNYQKIRSTSDHLPLVIDV